MLRMNQGDSEYENGNIEDGKMIFTFSDSEPPK